MHNEDRAQIQDAKVRGEWLPLERYPSYRFYLAHRAEMDRGAAVSWEARTLYGLMRARATNRRAFDTELQNNARWEEDRVFTDVRVWVQRLAHWVFFGACDPSMGQGQKSHPSGIVVGGWDREAKRLHVIHATSKRRVPTALQADLESAQIEYQCGAWAFEDNNAYAYTRQQMISTAVGHGVVLPLIGVTATVPPDVRINSLEPAVDGYDPRILVHPHLRALLEQLDSWPGPACVSTAMSLQFHRRRPPNGWTRCRDDSLQGCAFLGIRPTGRGDYRPSLRSLVPGRCHFWNPTLPPRSGQVALPAAVASGTSTSRPVLQS
jgi:hypothetical protein